MDTADTADTGAEYQEHQNEQEIISAAELAGETGGISCATTSMIGPLLFLTSITLIMFRRKS